MCGGGNDGNEGCRKGAGGDDSSMIQIVTSIDHGRYLALKNQTLNIYNSPKKLEELNC
jgi:hypothetical protein